MWISPFRVQPLGCREGKHPEGWTPNLRRPCAETPPRNLQTRSPKPRSLRPRHHGRHAALCWHARSGPEPGGSSRGRRTLLRPPRWLPVRQTRAGHRAFNCQELPSPGHSCQATGPSPLQIIRRAGHPTTALRQHGPLDPLRAGAFGVTRTGTQPHRRADLIQQPWGCRACHSRLSVHRQPVQAESAQPRTRPNSKEHLTKDPAHTHYQVKPA